MVSWSCSAPATVKKDAVISEHERSMVDIVRELDDMKIQTVHDNLTQYLAAIRGERIPDGLDPISRYSFVRGVRLHLDFAMRPDVEDLCSKHPQFARARNARLIMSDQVPEGLDLVRHVDRPYCIWHPDLASEQTYRDLTRRYPFMRYQVGRACAAAGYADLYAELDVLPDVSIAELARESEADGSRMIYDSIMSAPARFSVMNDYDRTVETITPSIPAFLNGDTAVRWQLTIRQPLSKKFGNDTITTRPFSSSLPDPDIEEDGRVSDTEMIQCHELDETDSEIREFLTIEESRLLYMPLPRDLPTVKKDLLIQMAAYEGNVDRYARLMRPNSMSRLELPCVVRGIFHHTMFARWWADQLETNPQRITQRNGIWHIQEAVNSRRVMVSDISGITNDTEYLPHLIWWPLRPDEYVLKDLAAQCPKMREQIGIAAIMCDYEHLYRSLELRPIDRLWLAAKQSPNPLYREDLQKRMDDLGIKGWSHIDIDGRSDCIAGVHRDLEPTSDMAFAPLSPHLMSNSLHEFEPYIGDRVDSGEIDRYVWLSPSLLRKLYELCGPHGWHGGLEWVEEQWRGSRGVDEAISVS